MNTPTFEELLSDVSNDIFNELSKSDKGMKLLDDILKKHSNPSTVNESIKLPVGWNESNFKQKLQEILDGKIPTPPEIDDDLDLMAFGFKDGQIIYVSPSRIKIRYMEDLANPIHKFEKHGMEWVKSVDFSEPVELGVDKKGHLYLEDGHHRWFASKKLGRKVKGKIVKFEGNPIIKIIQDGSKVPLISESSDAVLKEGIQGKSFWMAPSGKLYNVNGDHASWVLKNISKFSEGMKKSDFLEMFPKYANNNTIDREYGNEFLYSIMYEKGWVDVHASMDNLYARKNWGKLTNSQSKTLKNYAIEHKLVVRNPDTDSKIYDPLNESTITESRQELHSWMARNGKIYVVDDSGGNKSHSTFAKKKFGKSLEQMFELGFVRINYVASVLYAHYPKKYGKLSNSQIRTIKSLAVENGMSKVVRDDDEDSKIVWTNENSIECRYKKMLSELSTEEQKLVVDTTKEIMDIIMEDNDVQESSFNLDKVIQEGLLDFQTKHSNKFKHLPRQKKLFRDPSKKREKMSQRDFSVAANYESDRMHLNRVSKQQRKKNVFYNKSKERQNSDTEGMTRIAAVERLKQDKSKSEIVGMADFKKIVDAYNIQDIDAIFNGEIKKVGTNGITIQKYGENAFKLVKESISNE